MFRNIKQVVETVTDVRHIASFRKVPTAATVQSQWIDYSMQPGNPSAQYYAAAPLRATTLTRSANGGINHGPNVSPSTKYLWNILAMSTGASPAYPIALVLLDYLLFYPFCDDSTTDVQTMDNTNALSRYTDGKGVQIMAVSQAARTGGQTFRVTYTNQDGVPGRVTPTVFQPNFAATGSVIGTVANSASASTPFLPLQEGDTGVRSIQSVQMISGVDIGLFCLVLVKPIESINIVGVDAPTEKTFFTDASNLPIIQDNAYLNFVGMPQSTLVGTNLQGLIECTWR